MDTDDNPKNPEVADLEAQLAKLKLQAAIAEQQQKLIPPDAEAARRERDLKAAESEAKIAAERKKALESSLPTTEAKALEGKITIDDKVLIETETLAYRSLVTVAQRIAKTVGDKAGGKSILIHNDQDIGALVAFRAFDAQTKVLGDAYDAIARPDTPQPLFGLATMAVASIAVKSAIDLLALFRADSDIKGVAITPNELALAAAVAGQLAVGGRRVFISQIYPVDAIANRPAGTTIQQKLAMVRTKANAAQKRTADAAAADKPAADARFAELESIRKAYEDALSKPADASGTSTIATLMRGEMLQQLIGNGYVLYLKVIKAGGSNRVTRTLFSGSTLTHSGGAIVNFVLFDPDGSVAAAEIVSDYSGYVENVKKA